MNPKAITSDELYGTMSKSKEWKDGAIAVIMRNMSKARPRSVSVSLYTHSTVTVIPQRAFVITDDRPTDDRFLISQ